MGVFWFFKIIIAACCQGAKRGRLLLIVDCHVGKSLFAVGAAHFVAPGVSLPCTISYCLLTVSFLHFLGLQFVINTRFRALHQTVSVMPKCGTMSVQQKTGISDLDALRNSLGRTWTKYNRWCIDKLLETNQKDFSLKAPTSSLGKGLKHINCSLSCPL